MPCVLSLLLVGAFILAGIPWSLPADDATAAWRSVEVPGAIPAGPSWRWYRAWFRPHDSFFTPHERNLFAESVTLNLRGFAGAHEVFVNGASIGRGGSFPPEYRDGVSGNHRHKIPPGLLKKGQWNGLLIRAHQPEGWAGFQGEAPFVMDYFNEAILEGTWEWRPAGAEPPTATEVPVPAERPARAAFDQYHESHRVLGEAQRFVPGPRKTPAETMALMKPAADLRVDLLLHEPEVAQPTHFSFDARGRLWVAQYRQYPYPAGARMVSRDKYYRAHYDRVPEPPPRHTPGRDRITVHEDTDGDGLPDRHRVFVDGLNLANAVLPGRGGVWIMNTPYLLFFPDADGDDVPDGPPVVHLAGFGLEDTHSVANGLVWGPDGWIYGGQGSTTTSRVVRPGLDPEGAPGVHFEGCMVWRYHPVSREYELFAEGSGNVFGLELDGEGRLFSGHNGSETRGWHYQQGGYYLKQGVDPGKFGPPRNPHTFGQLPWMAPAAQFQRFTHLLSVVEGPAMPPTWQGQLLWLDPLHNVVLATDRHRIGSTFGTRDLGTALHCGDEAFRPVYLANAPDGSVWIADFYEHYIAHGQHYQSQIDPTTGRLYRLRGADRPLVKEVRLDDKSPEALLAALTHSNRWHRLMAARVLAERISGDPGGGSGRAGAELMARLKARVVADDAPIAALWALHQAGGLDEALAARLAGHPSALIREWSVRLMGDARRLGAPLLQAWLARLPHETDVRVRAQWAASARRLPAAQALPLLAALLAHDEDLSDPCLPLLCWWIIDSHWPAARPQVLALWETGAPWQRPLAREAVLPRLMRRCATEARRQDLLDAAWLLDRAPDAASVSALMAGFEEAFRGRDASALPDELVQALARRGKASLALRLRQRDPAALAEVLERWRSSAIPAAERAEWIRTLADLRPPGLRALLSEAVREGQPVPIRLAALAGLGREVDAGVATEVLGLLPVAPTEVRAASLALLVSRPAWSLSLLEAIGRQTVDRRSVAPEVVERLRRSPDPKVRDGALQVWPVPAAVPAPAIADRIRHLERVLREAPGNPYSGEAHFQQRCAGCHRLFFKGGSVGPDLTAYQRDHLGTLLHSILDPGAEIREGYASVEVETRDGRVLAGFLTERDARSTTVRGLDGQDHVLAAGEVLEVRPTGRSLMPEGLLDDLDDRQLRDFFAYLRSSQPFSR
ncbi:MAG: dehydrogenase [Verrucomicrobia bacterium]|nr:dehydrogenase [Verrucomicrobiota bacterium]